MADGALFQGTCYGSQGAALDAYYLAAGPSQAPGPTSYLNSFVKDAQGIWQLVRYQVDQAGQLGQLGQSAAPVIAFPSCSTLETFQDGMALGWGVVAAMVAAWGVAVLKRGL